MAPRLPVRGRDGRSDPALNPVARRPRLLAMGFLLLLSIGVYLPALRGGFVSDDGLILSRAQESSAAGGWTQVFREDLVATESGARSGFYRPLAQLSLLADRALYGDHPAGYHATSLVLHVATTWLVFAFALHAGLPLLAGSGAAALFAVHPVHVEAVAWISGRFDLLCGCFYVLALWLFARAHAKRSGAVYAAALVAGAAALLSKEMALTLPGGVLLADLLGISRGPGPRRLTAQRLWREGWRGAALRALPFVLLVVAYLVLRTTSRGLGFDASTTGGRLPRLELVGTAGRAVLYYMSKLIFPVHLDAFPVVPPVVQLGNAWFWLGLAVLCGIGFLGLRLWHRQPVAAFGLLFLLASLVPLSNALGNYPLAKSRFPVGERYLYLPSFGFVLAIVAIGWNLARRAGASQRRAFVIACSGCVLAGAARTLARIPDWRNNDVLLENTVRQNPQSPWAHLMLGSVRRQEGRYEEARASVETALRLNPRFFAAAQEMGVLFGQESRWEEAIPWFKKAIELEPRSRDAQLGLAMALRNTGRMPEAAQQFERMASLGARDSEFLVNRGELYLATGQLDAAERDFEAALAANPRRKEAEYNLGVVALHRGQFEPAVAHARRVLALDPRHAQAHMLLGSVEVRRENYAAAVPEFEAAAALDSTLVQAPVNLGATYLNLGDYPRAVAVLQASLARRPTAEAWMNLAEARDRMGDVMGAEAAFRAALELNPNLTIAQRGLGLLLSRDPARAGEARALLAPLAGSNPADAEVAAALAKLGNMAHSRARAASRPE